MKGLLAGTPPSSDNLTPAEYAHEAYDYATAMLAERQRRKERSEG